MYSDNGAGDTDCRSSIDDNKRLRYCIEMMTLAASDTEKLAALLMIPTLLKNKADNDDTFWIKLSECISSEFLRKMLNSNEDDVADTALVVLSRILSNNIIISKMVYSSLDMDVVHLFLKIHEKKELSLSFMEDIFNCILQLTKENKNSENINYLVKNENFFKSVDICMEKYPLAIVKFSFDLFVNFDQNNNFGNEIIFHKLMQIFVQRVEKDKTQVHFEILLEMSKGLVRIPLWIFACTSPHKWTKDIRNIIRGIYQSRLGENERKVAFNLTSALLHCYDISWIREDEEFLQIVVSLSCIELRLNLDFPLNEPINNDHAEMISSCCFILECALRLIIEEGDEENQTQSVPLSNQKLLQMLDSVVDLANFLLQFLIEVKENVEFFQQLPVMVAFSLHKMLTRFLEDGCELIDEQLILDSRDGFSILENICEKTVKEFEKAENRTF